MTAVSSQCFQPEVQLCKLAGLPDLNQTVRPRWLEAAHERKTHNTHDTHTNAIVTIIIIITITTTCVQTEPVRERAS
jgi:hypothetical protein